MNKDKLYSQLDCIKHNNIEKYTSDNSKVLRIKHNSFTTIEILHSVECNKNICYKI